MGTYFKPLRQKCGLLLLFVSCALMANLFRSKTRWDYVDFYFGNDCYGVSSINGCLAFSRTVEAARTFPNWISYVSTDWSPNVNDPFDGTPWSKDHLIDWRWDGLGCHIGASTLIHKGIPIRKDYDAMISYGLVVLPLAMISAYLLLFKPRQKLKAVQPDVHP